MQVSQPPFAHCKATNALIVDCCGARHQQALQFSSQAYFESPPLAASSSGQARTQGTSDYMWPICPRPLPQMTMVQHRHTFLRRCKNRGSICGCRRPASASSRQQELAWCSHCRCAAGWQGWLVDQDPAATASVSCSQILRLIDPRCDLPFCIQGRTEPSQQTAAYHGAAKS